MRTILILILLAAPFPCYPGGEYGLVPKPQRLIAEAGFVVVDAFPALSNIGYALLQTWDEELGAEGYKIVVDSNGPRIMANTMHGIQYGLVTLRQLVKPVPSNSGVAYSIPKTSITDFPRYPWRGMHLDVSRHFFSKAVIKQYLDLLAELKMNVFHWHLTDDQGWRVEIKGYPKLTEIGAWRIEKDGSRYGGYYTQDDIREIVAYASERYITVVPEIEMPAHASAAIAAYPELSCTPHRTKRVPIGRVPRKDLLCPSEFTFRFLREVMDEVVTLFPGDYIHLGGDEALKAAWRKSELAREVMEQNNLKNAEELQYYFMTQIENHLASRNRRAIAWGDSEHGGLSPGMTIMSWRDKRAGKKAMKRGNQAIMTPFEFCYFDFPSSDNEKKGAEWMAVLPLKKVYAFDPGPKGRANNTNPLLLGGQANVWTNHIANERELRIKIMPRLAAMAEALWTNPFNKNYGSFRKRLRQWNNRR